MKRKTAHIKLGIMAIMLLLFSLTSCVKEDNSLVEGIPTTLFLKTKGEVDKEKEITDIRVMLFRSSGEPLSNDLFTDITLTDPMKIETTTGERKMVILANTEGELSDKLSHSLTYLQTQALLLSTTYNEGSTLPFVYQTDLTVKEKDNEVIAAKLERAVCKVAMQISKDKELDNVEVKLLELQLLNTANKSWLLPRTTGDWVAKGGSDSPLSDLTTVTYAADNILSQTELKTISFTPYLYEYNTGDTADKTTSLRVKILNNGVEKEYILPFFFEGKDKAKTYGIKRNTFITLTATVYPKGIKIEKYTVDSWDNEAPWDKDVDPDGEDGNTKIEMWIDDDGRIDIDGLT